jgi:ankyrin repeat protein
MVTNQQFEAAVESIVNGELSTLRTQLASNPDLVHARSAREHESTLLHYVSANGVEDGRQKTPANIVEIADLLLAAGADVNAESKAYGGGSTTLGLTATSVHPEKAGVQIPLLTLLLDRGAIMQNGDVNACLANGRGQAAEFLADRGAPLDLEGAAGIGRLNLVESLFSSAPERQRLDGFGWACEYGRTAVVEFFLRNGIDLAAKLRPHGQTGLHWAAYSGHPDIVRLLLARGAPIDPIDDRWAGTPLDWALYAQQRDHRESHDEVIALLVQAGAKRE